MFILQLFLRSALIFFCCWFVSVPLTFGLSCFLCVAFTLSTCSVSLDLGAENSERQRNKTDSRERSFISKMKLLFQSNVSTNRVVVCYLALGYVEECFYFKYQKNEAVTVQ